MLQALSPMPTIRTGIFQKLEFAMENVAQTAELGIVKGPVGIGKSFAIQHLAKELGNKGYEVVSVTVKAQSEGSMSQFVNAVLAPYNATQYRVSDAYEVLENLLLARGFGTDGERRRVVLVVDESQGLKVNILEMLRGLWDRGDAFRLGDPGAPAFGLLLVGNDTFLARTGRARRAEYKPLMDRAFVLQLDRPNQGELEEFAASVFPYDRMAAKRLAELGVSRGNFRSMQKAYRQACFVAKNEPVGLEHVTQALFLAGGA